VTAITAICAHDIDLPEVLEYRRATLGALVAGALWGAQGCAWLQAPATPLPPPPAPEVELSVSASAYNSLAAQTDDTPRLTASGVLLEPGMRVIAVSPDLLEMGLRYGMRVEIDGMPGEWRVVDRMASRWRRSIDLYMGEDLAAARAWGRRNVTIRWRSSVPPEATAAEVSAPSEVSAP
jgi:3D (Asp-Asp-Asp) domain-containing protein